MQLSRTATALLTAACCLAASGAHAATPAHPASIVAAQGMPTTLDSHITEQTSKERVKEHAQALHDLTVKYPSFREAGTPGFDASIEFVKQQVTHSSATFVEQEFTHNGKATRNLVVKLPGMSSSEYGLITVGVHLDTAPGSPEYNGGTLPVAAAIEMLNNHFRAIECDVEVVFFGAGATSSAGAEEYLKQSSVPTLRDMNGYIDVGRMASPNGSTAVFMERGDKKSTLLRLAAAYADGKLVKRAATERESLDVFTRRGVDALALGSGGEGLFAETDTKNWPDGTVGAPYDPCVKAACDTPENYSEEVLDNTIVLTTGIADFIWEFFDQGNHMIVFEDDQFALAPGESRDVEIKFYDDGFTVGEPPYRHELTAEDGVSVTPTSHGASESPFKYTVTVDKDATPGWRTITKRAYGRTPDKEYLYNTIYIDVLVTGDGTPVPDPDPVPAECVVSDEVGQRIWEYFGVRRYVRVSDCDRAASSSATVTVDIDHQRPSDLGITLTTPSGERKQLRAVGSEGDASAIYTVDLSGEDADGTWRLDVTDRRFQQTGTLNSWTLTL